MIDVAVRGIKLAQDFADFQRRLEPGDILLTSPKPSTAKDTSRRMFDTAFAAVSKQMQNSPQTHSLLYAGNGKVVEARIGLGVRHLGLAKAVKDLDTVALRPVNATKEERMEAAQRARALVKKKPGYAMKGIVKALLREHNLPDVVGKVDGVICSDLITNAYGVDLTNKPRDAVLPVDFARSTSMMQVGEHLGATGGSR